MSRFGTALVATGLALCARYAEAAPPGPVPLHPDGSSARGAVPVEIVRTGARYQLLRGGQPYAVRGAGVESGHIASVAAHGGNSIRTWRTDNARQILDAAHQHGLTVLMCIEIGRERHGFDYDDRRAVARQFEFARGEVLKYKDHPALLAWMIGNEPDMQYTNPRVFDAINDISRMIHEIDGRHPTTTALSGFSAGLAAVVAQRAPDLDFLSVQMYGDIVNLPRYLEETGFDRPLMVTEWGTVGHWEVGKTAWGAPIEQNSSQKAQHFLHAYRTAIEPAPAPLIGSYVFLWGSKQERTPTWYGMFLKDGSETESVDVMHYIWNGEWPQNRSPAIELMRLDGRTAEQSVVLDSGQRVMAEVLAAPVDNDPLAYRWVVMRESAAVQVGGDAETVPEEIHGVLDEAGGARVAVTAPAEPGAYRLFVYVDDGRGRAGHANIPFLVREPGRGG